MPKLLFCIMSLKIILLKWLPHLPGASESKSTCKKNMNSTMISSIAVDDLVTKGSKASAGMLVEVICMDDCIACIDEV